MFGDFDIIVVGAGHAGCEAAYVSATLGSKVLLITQNLNNIAQLSCNPAMGGVAKGQIVREIDALGGYSGIVTDMNDDTELASLLSQRVEMKNLCDYAFSSTEELEKFLFEEE